MLDDPIKPRILPIGSIHHLTDEVHCKASFLPRLGLYNSTTKSVGDPNHLVDVEQHQDGAVGPDLRQSKFDRKADQLYWRREKQELPAMGPFLVLCQKALTENCADQCLDVVKGAFRGCIPHKGLL